MRPVRGPRLVLVQFQITSIPPPHFFCILSVLFSVMHSVWEKIGAGRETPQRRVPGTPPPGCAHHRIRRLPFFPSRQQKKKKKQKTAHISKTSFGRFVLFLQIHSHHPPTPKNSVKLNGEWKGKELVIMGVLITVTLCPGLTMLTLLEKSHRGTFINYIKNLKCPMA